MSSTCPVGYVSAVVPNFTGVTLNTTHVHNMDLKPMRIQGKREGKAAVRDKQHSAPDAEVYQRHVAR